MSLVLTLMVICIGCSCIVMANSSLIVYSEEMAISSINKSCADFLYLKDTFTDNKRVIISAIKSCELGFFFKYASPEIRCNRFIVLEEIQFH